MAMMATSRTVSDDLGAVKLDEAIQPTADLAASIRAPVLVIAVPTQALRSLCKALSMLLPGGHAVISAAKGLEQQSGRFVTEIMTEELGNQRFGILSGPSFARDVAVGMPTAVSLAMADGQDAQAVAAYLGSPGFRIYHSTDIRGVEIGGAAKNVLAIAAGIVGGMALGESARAAIVTRGFAEMRPLAASVGARSETLMGLSGLGDLLLTASSAQSRNFSLGLALGRGLPVHEARSGKLAEGVFTAQALHELACARGIDMPIVAGVHAVLAGQSGVHEAMSSLMSRPFREE
jgi:glycerol-3-phosphate dehydrogenase (NAD(P)+)